jgi:hypothetical protein
MDVEVLIEGGAEALDEGDGAALVARDAPPMSRAPAELGEERAEEGAKHLAREPRVVEAAVAERIGERKDPLAHRLIGQMEARMTGGLSRQLDEIHLVAERLRRLEAMADRQYVSLMLYPPDVGEGEAKERSASANRRYQAWRRAVDKVLDSPKRRP